MSDLTLMLQNSGSDGQPLSEKLLPPVYDELRRLAAARMAGDVAGQSRQPTALVHETWLRLADVPGRVPPHKPAGASRPAGGNVRAAASDAGLVNPEQLFLRLVVDLVPVTP